MKRDCGEGELIPIRWQTVSSTGETDDETEQNFITQQEALLDFEAQRQKILDTECSDVRLYAIDKQGYANCVKMLIHAKGGNINETDKLDQL